MARLDERSRASLSSSLLEHLLSERLELLGAGLQADLGLSGRRRAQHIARTELVMPAAEALQVLLLLVELCGRELFDGDLVSDLGVELVAFGEELDPLGLAALDERALELGRPRATSRTRDEDEHLSIGPLHEGTPPLEGLAGLAVDGQRPRRL